MTYYQPKPKDEMTPRPSDIPDITLAFHDVAVSQLKHDYKLGFVTPVSGDELTRIRKASKGEQS